MQKVHAFNAPTPNPTTGAKPFIKRDSNISPTIKTIHRSITSIVDHRKGDAVLRATAELLDPLTAEAVSLLRVALAQAHTKGRSLITCATCGESLYLTTAGIAQNTVKDGRRTFFAHRASAKAQACPMKTKDSRHPDAVDATRFNGQQEGHRHEWLKRGLTAMLEADPAFDTVAQERVVLHDGQRRRPDVQAVGPDGPVAFEVQLATPQLPTVLARAAFYAAAGYRLVWIIDGGAGNDLLLRQGFQDILWMQGGQILALDSGCLADAGRTGRAQVLHVSIRETATGFEFADNRVGLAYAVDKVCPANGDARPLVAGDPAARAVFAALRSGSQRDVRAALDTLCRSLDVALSGMDALDAGLPTALCALGTLLTGRKHDASNFKETGHAHAILNVFLNTPRHRVWAQLLPMARGLSSEADLNLRHGSTALKLAAALGSLRTASIPSDPIPVWAPVIARLFPRLAPALGACLRT